MASLLKATVGYTTIRPTAVVPAPDFQPKRTSSYDRQCRDSQALTMHVANVKIQPFRSISGHRHCISHPSDTCSHKALLMSRSWQVKRQVHRHVPFPQPHECQLKQLQLLPVQQLLTPRHRPPPTLQYRPSPDLLEIQAGELIARRWPLAYSRQKPCFPSPSPMG